ncbi:MAG: flippase-like domain-containing protein [Desulfobacterales bacterium]|nr:flippase-like domain-containing protein [Desulfobacterales bacterium]
MGEKISKRSLIVKVIISGCFFWILLSFVQTDQLVEVVSHIDWFYFALSFLLTPVMLVVSCLKWKMILDLHEKKIPFLMLIRIYLIGYFFSNLLPSTVGGDVTRSYYSGKIIKNQSFSAIAIFIERFTGVFMLMVLVIISPLMKAGLYKSPYIYVPSIISIALILIILLIWRFRQSLKLLHRFAQAVFSLLHKSASASGIRWLTSFTEVLEKIYQKIYSRLEKLHDEMKISFTTIRKDRSLSLKIIYITVLFYALACLNVYVAFMAFGVRPEFISTCALVPTALFVAQVPVTLLGNMGFFESVFVFYFLLIGIPGAETLAMGLLLRLKMLTIGVVGYFVYLSYNHTTPIDEDIDQLAGDKRI